MLEGAKSLLKLAQRRLDIALHFILIPDSVIEDEVKLSIWQSQQEKTGVKRGERWEGEAIALPVLVQTDIIKVN